MKKLIALILTICLAASCIALPASAIDENESIIPVRNPAVYTSTGVFPSLGMFLYNGSLTLSNIRSFIRTILNIIVGSIGEKRFVTGISLPDGIFEIPMGQDFILEATLLPTATKESGSVFMLRDYGINWKVDDSSVCSVNDGKIIPVGIGQTTVYAISNDGNFVDSVIIKVVAPSDTENTTTSGTATEVVE